MPVPVGWPPRGSPSGRWRAVGGRRCVPVAPEGVAFLLWRCRCLSGGPRGGRRLGGGVGPGPVRWRLGAPKSAGACVAGRRWGSEELRGAPVCVPPNPCGAGSPLPRGGLGLSVPWSGSPLPRGGLGLSGRGRALRVLFRGRAVGGSWGYAAGCVASPRRGGGAGCLRGSAPPKGGGLTSAPGGAAGWVGQAPSGPVCRRASAFRRRSSAWLRGVISTRRGRTSWLPRRGGAVRFRGSAGGAEAPSLLLRVRFCLAGAEAPVGRLREPLRGLSAPPKGIGRPGAACAVVPSGPKAFWSPCFAEAQLGRHGVPLFRQARRLSGVPALPKHSWADTSRLTEVGWVRFRRGGPGCVLGCPRTRRR